jgi:OOP family OmpA-OmpF porin
MKIKKASFAAILAVGMALPLAGMAQSMADRGWYVGGSIGQSDVEESLAGGLITSGEIDGKDTAFKAFGGYMFNRYVGAEVAYVDLGKVRYSGEFFGDQVTGGKVEVSGFNIAAVGAIPVSAAFSIFGKLGLFSWDAEASDTTGGVPFSAKSDGSDVSFGAGVSYRFTRHLAARAEWERFKLDDVDADLLSVGLLYKF